MFIIFALLDAGRNVSHTYEKCVHAPHLNNVLTLPCSTEAVTFQTYNALLEYDPLLKHDVKHNIHQVGLQKNKLIVTRYVQNVCHWLEHKRASVLATGQLHHQSVTAQGHATHAADAVVALSLIHI